MRTEREIADMLAKALYGMYIGEAVDTMPPVDEVLAELNKGAAGCETEADMLESLAGWAYARKGEQ